jgi:hypothetical protein
MPATCVAPRCSVAPAHWDPIAPPSAGKSTSDGGTHPTRRRRWLCLPTPGSARCSRLSDDVGHAPSPCVAWLTHRAGGCSRQDTVDASTPPDARSSPAARVPSTSTVNVGPFVGLVGPHGSRVRVGTDAGLVWAGGAARQTAPRGRSESCQVTRNPRSCSFLPACRQLLGPFVATGSAPGRNAV